MSDVVGITLSMLAARIDELETYIKNIDSSVGTTYLNKDQTTQAIRTMVEQLSYSRQTIDLMSSNYLKILDANATFIGKGSTEYTKLVANVQADIAKVIDAKANTVDVVALSQYVIDKNIVNEALGNRVLKTDFESLKSVVAYTSDVDSKISAVLNATQVIAQINTALTNYVSKGDFNTLKNAAITATQLSTALGAYVPATGGTYTGPTYLTHAPNVNDPTDANHLVSVTVAKVIANAIALSYKTQIEADIATKGFVDATYVDTGVQDAKDYAETYADGKGFVTKDDATDLVNPTLDIANIPDISTANDEQIVSVKSVVDYVSQNNADVIGSDVTGFPVGYTPAVDATGVNDPSAAVDPNMTVNERIVELAKTGSDLKAALSNDYLNEADTKQEITDQINLALGGGAGSLFVETASATDTYGLTADGKVKTVPDASNATIDDAEVAGVGTVRDAVSASEASMATSNNATFVKKTDMSAYYNTSQTEAKINEIVDAKNFMTQTDKTLLQGEIDDLKSDKIVTIAPVGTDVTVDLDSGNIFVIDLFAATASAGSTYNVIFTNTPAVGRAKFIEVRLSTKAGDMLTTGNGGFLFSEGTPFGLTQSSSVLKHWDVLGVDVSNIGGTISKAVRLLQKDIMTSTNKMTSQ